MDLPERVLEAVLWLHFGRDLNANCTLHELLTAAENSRWRSNEERVYNSLELLSENPPKILPTLQKIYAERRATLRGLLAKYPISTQDTELETPLTGKSTDAALKDNLSDKQFSELAEARAVLDENLKNLAEKVSIRTDPGTNEVAHDVHKDQDTSDKLQEVLWTSVNKRDGSDLESIQRRPPPSQAERLLAMLMNPWLGHMVERHDRDPYVAVNITFDMSEAEEDSRIQTLKICLKYWRRLIEDLKPPPVPPVPPPAFGPHSFDKQSVVMYWKLGFSVDKPTTESLPRNLVTEGALNEAYLPAILERLMHQYERVRVDSDELLPEGKYRGICKIVMRSYENHESNLWASGTGWLIDDDIVITAAHNLFAKEPHTDGTPTIVKDHVKDIIVAIGYGGIDTSLHSKVEIRRGKSIVLHSAYYEKAPGRENPWADKFDIGAIKLEQPFQESKCFEWKDTPLEGDTEIEVVGYPGDLPEREGNRGGAMYKSTQPISYNLQQEDRWQIPYSVDTFPGNSGGPVIETGEGQGKVIGIHAYGYHARNAATVLGHLGNKPCLLRRALNAMEAESIPDDVVTERVTLNTNMALTGHRISLSQCGTEGCTFC